MNKTKPHFPTVAILLITLILVLGEVDAASHGPGRWGELSGGLRLRASVDSAVVRSEDIGIAVDLLVAHDSSRHNARLSTRVDGARLTLQVYDEKTGGSRRSNLTPGRRNFPDFDIALDSVSDSIQLGTVQFSPFLKDWPTGDHVWAKLELFIPTGTDGHWSGVLTSAPFELILVEPEFDMEEFSFVVPTKLTLIEGPSISYDSASVDTITVQSRVGYHRGASTQSSGGHIAGPLAANTDDKGKVNLPFLPHMFGMRPLPGTGLFVDGRTTIEFKVDLFEAQNKPRFYHGVNETGPHRILWQRTFGLTVSKDELLALTPSADDQIDYRTCMVPHRLRLEGNKQLFFERWDTSPQELQVKKGNALGYTVRVDGQDIGCFEGYPQSPLIKLPKHPSCDSPAEVIFRIFHYEKGSFPKKDDWRLGHSQTLWLSKCTIDSDSGAFDLEASDDFGPRRSGWRRWRRCRIPRNLSLTADGRIEFDSTDMHSVDFRPWSDHLPLIRITVGEHPPKLVSTQLSNPLALWHPTDQRDTSVVVRIDIITPEPPALPDAATTRALWSKSYRVSASGTVTRPDEGVVK